MYMHIDNPMEPASLFPHMAGHAVLVGETPMVVMRENTTVWTKLPDGEVTNHQVNLMDLIGQRYPEIAWQVHDGYVLGCADPLHWVIRWDGSYQWHLPDGTVLQFEAGESLPEGI